MIDFTLIAALLVIIPIIANILRVNQKYGFWSCVFLLMALSALRGPGIGNDTAQYANLFNAIAEDRNFDYINTRYEIGYLLFNKIISLFTHNSQWVFVIYSFLIYFSVGRFISKYSRLPWLSLFLFFSYGFFSFTFSALRQGMAIAILLFSYDYIEKRKFLKFVSLALLAYCFHTTAILFIIAYFASYFRPTVNNFVRIAILGILGMAAFNVFFGYAISSSEYSHYSDTTYIGDSGLANYLYAIISSLILAVSFYILKRQHVIYFKEAYTDRICMILVAFAIAIYIVSLKANIFDRLAIYFNIFSIVLLPNAYTHLKTYPRVYAKVLTSLAFYVYTSVILILRPEWSSIYPYSFFFNT